MSDAPERALREALLLYLQQHPNAMDTLEGIADWWLPRNGVRPTLDQVLRVLHGLEEQGVIERVGGDERPLFRARRASTPSGDDAPQSGR